MLELAKQFIGEECIIHFLSNSTTGTIKEISESGNALLLEQENNLSIINLEYVIRIQKYPRNKKGKKKTFVLE